MLGNKVPGTEMVGSVPTAGFHVRPFRFSLVPSPLAPVSRLPPCLACGAPWCLTCWAHAALRRTVCSWLTCGFAAQPIFWMHHCNVDRVYESCLATDLGKTFEEEFRGRLQEGGGSSPTIAFPDGEWGRFEPFGVRQPRRPNHKLALIPWPVVQRQQRGLPCLTIGPRRGIADQPAHGGAVPLPRHLWSAIPYP